MIFNVETARTDWAARVSKQAEQMLVIASATRDGVMREELFGYAHRLAVHADQILGG